MTVSTLKQYFSPEHPPDDTEILSTWFGFKTCCNRYLITISELPKPAENDLCCTLINFQGVMAVRKVSFRFGQCPIHQISTNAPQMNASGRIEHTKSAHHKIHRHFELIRMRINQ